MQDRLKSDLQRLLALDEIEKGLQEKLRHIRNERAEIVPELIDKVVGEYSVVRRDGVTYSLEGDIDEFAWIKISNIDDLGEV